MTAGPNCSAGVSLVYRTRVPADHLFHLPAKRQLDVLLMILLDIIAHTLMLHPPPSW